MTTEQIIETLREYNAWRRGGEGEMLDPKLIGKAIDAACDAMETMQRERDETQAQIDELNKQLIETSKMGVDLLIERDEALNSIARMHEIIRSEWPKSTS